MTQNSFQMVSSAVSDRGLSEKRPQNEDSYLEMPEHGLFAVADGVGGAQAGDVASQMAMEQLAEVFSNLIHAGRDIEELMSIAITRANGSIFQMSHELSQLSTMATTIVALQISGNIATIGHVGDSRLYRLDARGNLFRETQDHSVVEEEVRAGRMTPEQAENHPSKNVISRALGAESTVEIDMKTIMFEPNTVFLLCSDGITRHISDVEIRELLASSYSPVEICAQMKQICYERGAEDNLTAVIIKLTGEDVSAISDYEENTVAATRQSFYAEESVSSSDDYDEIPTQNLQLPEEARQYQTQESLIEEPINQLQEQTDEEIQVTESHNEPNTSLVEKEEPFLYEEEKSGSGAVGKFFLLLVGLILGGALGAAGYNYMFGSTAKEEISRIPQMESQNIQFKTFEDNRRNVDKDPARFLTTVGTSSDDAEGFYLRGRANLLLGKYDEAKSNFAKAKELLVEFNGADKVMLENEIAIAVSALENPLSIKKLEAEKTKGATTANGNTNVSSNSNAGSGNSNSGNTNK